MTNEERWSFFNQELNYISNTSIRQFARFLLTKTPEWFFHVPASNTGKYHPKYALGEGGLVRHTKAAIGIYHALAEAEIPLFCLYDTPFGGNAATELDDACYLALMFHDCMKLGTGDNPQHTVHEHPLLAADFMEAKLREFLYEHDFDMSDAIIVQEAERAIRSHMGKWNMSKYSSTILPTPLASDWTAKLVHLCDLLASRKQLEYQFEVTK